ncbi:MAG TPA: pyrroline-5-carboxylate reductase [Euzebyales bacterium]|nr:pyrroline-5-carboxylate reductase [Euzebyales bacterium]
MSDTDQQARRLAILGTGRMGEALLSGLLRSGAWRADQIVCTTRSERRAQQVAERHDVTVHTNSADAAAGADVVLIAVKPQSMAELLAEIAAKLHRGQTLISVAAGVSTATIEAALLEDLPVVRVMSNVPVQVDEAMSVLAAGAHAGPADVEVARTILGHVGKVIELAEEQLDAVTGLSGSGPAYVFLLAETMIDAAILLGLPRDVATELIAQTMVGSAHMLRDSGRHPVELRESVTSPGGTTIAAIRVLEQERVRAAFINAIEAATLRSRELGS